MSATGSVENAFTFVKGLVTEGGFLLHPKDAWKEGFNVTPSIDGSVERRPGFELEELYETFYPLVTLDEQPNWAYTVEKWESVNGEGTLDFFVVQFGPNVFFYEASTGTTSAKRKTALYISLPFWGFTGRTGIVGTSPIKVTSAYGKLIITNRDMEPILVIYNKETDSIDVQTLTLKIRDFDGIRSPVTQTIEYNQTTWESLSFWPHALYNLYNQGWRDPELTKYKDAHNGNFPSNAKQWIYGKNANDDFDNAVIDKQDFGSMVAPKGRIILDAFYQDRAGALADYTNVNNGANGVIESSVGGANSDDEFKIIKNPQG